MKRQFIKAQINVILIIWFLLFIFPYFSYSQGDLLITPMRIIFDGSKRSEDLNLANIGKDTATYVISFVQIKMKNDGSFQVISEPDSGQNFADKNLRIFPRTVTLAPNEAQLVKLQVYKRNELSPGEYRSHLYFRALPNSKALGEGVKNDSTVSVKLVPVYGISIPVIIRHGETSARIVISDISFQTEQDTIPILNMIFTREGNCSVYGDIGVDHISTYGKVTRVADARGVAVYTPNPFRKIKIILNRYAGADLSSGKLRITYSAQLPKNTILAQSEIEL